MSMTRESKRQAVLVGALGVAVVAYLQFGAGFDLLPAGSTVSADELPAIDAVGLERSIKGVSTVEPGLVIGAGLESAPDRNLFQYGSRRPPPPTPPTAAELEAQRRAAEEAVKEQERQAIELKAQQEAQAEALRRQQELAEALRKSQPPEPVMPAGPPPKKPPEINFKYIGVMGPMKNPVATLLDGQGLVLGRKGEVIQGKFRLLDVGGEWVEIGYVDPDFANMKKRIHLGL